MIPLTSLKNNWFSTKGNEKVETLRKQLVAEVLSVRDQTLENAKKMEKEMVDAYHKLIHFPYKQKLEKFDFARLRQIEKMVDSLRFGTVKNMEISLWCFEHLDDPDVEKNMKLEALHCFNLFFETKL